MEQCKHGSRKKIAEHTGGVYDCIDFRCTACGALIRVWDTGEINIYQEGEGADGKKRVLRIKCNTCEKIETLNNCSRKHEDGERGITEVLKASLQLVSFNKNNQRVGNLGCRARPLNYCPECGRHIERSETIWRL